MKIKRKVIIVALLVVLLAMAIGYSAFAEQLNLNGKTKIVGEWDVRIVNIEAINVSEGCDAGKPQYTNTSATFDAKLSKPGDSITYVITIENAGTIDATLETVIFMEQPTGSEAIKYTTTTIDPFLEVGNQTNLKVKVEYDANTTEIPSVKSKTLIGIIEYVQR